MAIDSVHHHESVDRSDRGSEKLFGKYDELIRMLLGFLLTGVLGTYFSHKYTTEQADLASAGKVFNDYSKLAGDRYFSQSRLNQVLKVVQKDGEKISDDKLNQRIEAYRDAVQVWNSTRGFNREMIRLYFGQPLWNSERDIHYSFRSWGQALEAEIKNKGATDLSCLDSEIDKLLSAINALQAGMATAMQQGKVGRSKTSDEVPETTRPATICQVHQ